VDHSKQGRRERDGQDEADDAADEAAERGYDEH
jgi:hypothetical protein